MGRRLALVHFAVCLVLAIALVSCVPTEQMPTAAEPADTPIPTHTRSPLIDTPVPPTPTAVPPTPTREPLTATSIPVPPTHTPLPPSITEQFPIGKFYHEHASGSFCVYQWNDDGTWLYFWGVPSLDVSVVRPYLQGTYTSDKEVYTETVGEPNYLCPWQGTYEWSFDGEQVYFQVVGEDKCAERQMILETKLWIKVEE